MPLEFSRSELLTFGVELELMVLNTRDYDLARGAADILPRLAKLKLPGEVKPEITESMIEVNSSVHRRYDELLRELITVRDAIVETADTTVVVHPRRLLHVDPLGNFEITFRRA